MSNCGHGSCDVCMVLVLLYLRFLWICVWPSAGYPVVTTMQPTRPETSVCKYEKSSVRRWLLSIRIDCWKGYQMDEETKAWSPCCYFLGDEESGWSTLAPLVTKRATRAIQSGSTIRSIAPYYWQRKARSRADPGCAEPILASHNTVWLSPRSIQGLCMSKIEMVEKSMKPLTNRDNNIPFNRFIRTIWRDPRHFGSKLKNTEKKSKAVPPLFVARKLYSISWIEQSIRHWLTSGVHSRMFSLHAPNRTAM